MIAPNKLVRKTQKGFALLVLVIAIALAISTYYFSAISIVDIQVNNIERTHHRLKQAKKALIDYAIMHADGMGSGDAGEFGYLPCPHISIAGITVEGNQQSDCGTSGKNTIGYLPWKTLGVGALRDASGNCLWYGVSGSYKNADYAGLINEDTSGMFQIIDSGGAVVAGADPEDRIVAVIFAPNPPLKVQARIIDSTKICGDDGTNIGAYLENVSLDGGADKIDQFIHASLTSHTEETPYNDYFITISRDEIWQAILLRSDFKEKMKNLTQALALCLSKYATSVAYKRLPWPALMNLVDYRDDINYSDANQFAGRYPFSVGNSNTKITGASDVELFEQGDCGSLITATATVDLKNASSEYRRLWSNWKDHFFYIVSEDFSPDITDGSCGTCIKYEGAEMAAIVIYSGSREAGQLRRGPEVGANTKDSVANYIENNVVAFNSGSASGSAAYFSSPGDIMFCVKLDLSVAEC